MADERHQGKNSFVWRWTTIALGIVGVVVFLLTEDLSGQIADYGWIYGMDGRHSFMYLSIRKAQES